jgi:ribosome-associated protein
MGPEYGTCIESEVRFESSRSSGPGGQHVNKVSTKVTLRFYPEESLCLTKEQIELIRIKLAHKIHKDGSITLQCDTTRSQYRNKGIALKKLFELLRNAFEPEYIRKQTAPSRKEVLARLAEKKSHSEKKANRKWRPE